MRLDISTGELEIIPTVQIYPGMPRQVFEQQAITEPDVWIMRGGQPVAYRLKVPITNGKKRQELILITYFSLQDNCPLIRWELKPADNFDGAQKRPEGKFTKLAREWFKKNFKVDLPIVRPWGDIDAAYDPHNLETVIIFDIARATPSRATIAP